jgi:hypothetical protein
MATCSSRRQLADDCCKHYEAGVAQLDKQGIPRNLMACYFLLFNLILFIVLLYKYDNQNCTEFSYGVDNFLLPVEARDFLFCKEFSRALKLKQPPIQRTTEALPRG